MKNIIHIYKKINDVLMIHYDFLAAPLPLHLKLRQLVDSYASLFMDNKRVSYLGKPFFYETSATPLLIMTYVSEILFLDSLVNLTKCKIVIDIGANVGQWSETITRLYPHIQIYSFEPNMQAFKVLQKNQLIKSHSHIYPYAVGNIRDSKLFVPMVGSAEGSMLSNEVRGKTFIKNIKTVSLNRRTCKAFVLPTNVDIVKIDVEGYEPTVLHNIKGITMKYMSIEVNLTENVDKELNRIRQYIRQELKCSSTLLGIQKTMKNSPKGNAILMITKL